MDPFMIHILRLMIFSSFGFPMLCGAVGEFAVNIAYGKPATQSSTYIGNIEYGDTPGYPYNASLAVDGNRNTSFKSDGCSHTDVNSNSFWWEVDLMDLYNVLNITIYQRSDANTNWLSGFVTKGKLSNDSWVIIDNPKSNMTGTIIIPVNTNLKFKGIRIELTKRNEHAAICLCEVEVLAEINVAEKKLAKQSSIYNETSTSFIASLAIDGNTNTNFAEKSCSCTNPGDRNPWWSVDLQAVYFVIGIRIYQRVDAVRERLNGFTLVGVHANGSNDTIQTPKPYKAGEIVIHVAPPKMLKEIRVHLNDGAPDGGPIITLCEVQVFAGTMCPKPPSFPGKGLYKFIPGYDGNWSYNFSLIIHCIEGYIMDGPISVRCVDTNRWNGTFGLCSVKRCNEPVPQVSHGVLAFKDGIEGNGTYDTIVSLNCHQGYKRDSIAQLRCADDGQWQGILGLCLVKRCDQPVPQVSHGVLAFQGGIEGNGTYNTIVSLNCLQGYKRDSIGHLRCEDDEQWQGTLGLCLVKRCNQPIPQVSHGVLAFQDGIEGNRTYDTIVSLNCHQGYNRDSIGRIRCADEQWQGNLGLCLDIDECTQAGICQYHGKCSNTDGSFACNCSAGYNGTTCENDIDECTMQDSACHNHGQCSNTEGSFECQCGNGYVGATCETAVPEQSSTAGIAGGVTAAICLLVIIVIIAFIRYQRRAKRPEDKIVDTSLGELRSSSDKKEYVEEVILETSIYAQTMDINNPNQDAEYDESNTVYMNKNDNSRDYYSFTPEKLTDKHSVRVEDLASFILSRKKEPNLYEEEYNNLPDGLTRSYEAALLSENKSKNRYKNIYPYDDSRVKLEIWDTSNEGDYINASYVNGFMTYHTYIAAQGPTKGILNDFWRMIWQTKCCKIVMLTNLMEEGKHKCEQYWPDEGSVDYGDIVIRLIQCQKFSDFTIRTLSIGKKNGKSKGGKTETRQIIQFHFTAWPDRGVPRFASSLVHFRQKICAAHTQQQAEGPMAVHCSAGIGRTGTFLALDYLLEQAEEVGYINVVKCVETIRKQRVNLVQTLGQYIFLHEALLEALTCTALAVSTSEFQETHTKLTKMDKSTRKRMLDDEFEKLPMYVSDPEEDVYENAKNMENCHKNRYSNILPDKNHCPFLNVYVKGRDSYINAVFLPAYKENNIFIITQTPLENTIVDFWRMVYQFEVSSIVMLNTLSEMKEEERYWTEDNKRLETGPFRITLESKSCDDISTNYTMLLHYNNESRRVRLSRATYWADGKPVPMSPTTMLKQIDLIEKWQQESGSKPIIVHCMNGAERSGLFCVIAALLERTKIEQDVAVEQIIKQMRSRRPQIIPNVEQFRFCYDAMLAYLNTFDTYSNFTGL